MGLQSILFLSLVGLLAVAVCSDDPDIDKVEHRLYEVYGRVHSLERKLDYRLNPKFKQKAQSLAVRVIHHEEPVCHDGEYRCGLNGHQCVSDLFVCDGHDDCRNGEDEKHCDSPIHDGDVFKGQMVWDHCGGPYQPVNHEIVFRIDGVRKTPNFTPMLHLHAVFELQLADRWETTKFAEPANAYYNFATHNLVIFPPRGRAYGLVCKFDGYNFDKCVGETTAEGSLDVCSRYIYFRQK